MTEFQTLENPLSGGVPVGRGGFFGGWDVVEFPTIGNELDQAFTTAVARGGQRNSREKGSEPWKTEDFS